MATDLEGEDTTFRLVEKVPNHPIEKCGAQKDIHCKFLSYTESDLKA